MSELRKIGVLSKILTGEPIGKRPLGRPGRRWKDNFRNKLMILIKFTTSQSSSHPIVLTRLGVPRSKPNQYLKLWNCWESTA